MTQYPHILVIGGGLIGIANARAFMTRGARVTLIERQASIGHGAGFANSGMIHPSQAWPWVESGLDETVQLLAARSVVKLAKHAPNHLKQRMRSLSLPDIDRSGGCYQIFDNPRARNTAQTRYKQIGIHAQACEQISRPALYFPGDFSADAYAWCRAEINALCAEGLDLHLGAQVKLTPSNAGIKAVINENIISADHIILCAGHGTNTVLSPLDLHLPLQAVRGFALDFNAASLNMTLPKAPVMDAASRTALTIFRHTLRLSGTLGEVSARPLWQRWCHLMPELMRQLPRPRQVWSGDRPVSLLGRPFITETPHKGLWVNTGHGHMGWTLSMASGELMAQMILDGETAPDFAWPQ